MLAPPGKEPKMPVAGVLKAPVAGVDSRQSRRDVSRERGHQESKGNDRK